MLVPSPNPQLYLFACRRCHPSPPPPGLGLWQGQVRRRRRETLAGEAVTDGRAGGDPGGFLRGSRRGAERVRGRAAGAVPAPQEADPASLLPTSPQGPGGGGLPLPAPRWPPLLVPSARPRGTPRRTSAAPPHVPRSRQVAQTARLCLWWLPHSCYRVGLPRNPAEGS